METDAHVPAGGHSDIKRIPIDQSFCRTRNFPFLQAFDDLQRKDPQLRPRFREALSSLVVLGPGAVLRGRRARFSFSCQAQAEIKYTRKMPFFFFWYVAHCSSSSTVDPAFSTRPPPSPGQSAFIQLNVAIFDEASFLSGCGAHPPPPSNGASRAFGNRARRGTKCPVSLIMYVRRMA